MFPDHENPSNIAAAAATAPGNSEASTPEEAAPPVAEQAESTDGAPANLAPAPAMATEVSLSQKAAAAANGAEAPGELAAAEAGRAEESAAAEEEAAGSEAMSKLMQGFDENQEAGSGACLPGSRYDGRRAQNRDELRGTEVEVRGTRLNRRRGNVVVSRRVILEEGLHAKRAALMDTLSEGQVVRGHVKNVTDYGAFVDLGGIDGLLHLTDLSWGRVKHPSDAVKTDQELDVMILKFDKDKQRISLGLKQLTPDPWVGAAERYPAGGKVQGKIVGIVDYGG